METSKTSSNVINLAMPRGMISFAPVNDDGNMTGEIDLGNCTALELTNALEYKEHLTSHDDVVVLDAKKISAAKWTLKITPEEFSAENMALFFLADPDKQKGTTPDRLEQTGPVGGTSISPTFYADRWMDFGFKYIKPGTIVITEGQITLEITELTSGNYEKYRVDYENGMVMVKGNQGFVEGETVEVTFLYGSCSLKKFTPRIRPLIGYLRYRGLSEVGPRHAVEVWKVQIHPDAALALIKPQDYASLSFAGDVFIDDETNSHRATDPFFKVYELDAATSYPLS